MTALFSRLRQRRSGVKLLGAGAIYFGLVAGCASWLAGGSAQAKIIQDACTFGLPGATCPGYVSPAGLFGDKTFAVVKAPNQGAGLVNFTWYDVAPDGVDLADHWSSEIHWNDPGLVGPTAGGLFDYTVSIDPSNPLSFGEITLDSQTATGGTTATKEVFKGLSDDPANSLGLLTSVDGSHQHLELAGTGLKQLYIRDGWSIPERDHVLQSVTNGINQVPGPLPLLGAAAAFGWSRKLRRRVGALSLG